MCSLTDTLCDEIFAIWLLPSISLDNEDGDTVVSRDSLPPALFPPFLTQEVQSNFPPGPIYPEQHNRIPNPISELIPMSAFTVIIIWMLHLPQDSILSPGSFVFPGSLKLLLNFMLQMKNSEGRR